LLRRDSSGRKVERKPAFFSEKVPQKRPNILDLLLLSVINLSVQTVEIVEGLPKVRCPV
jgi:hypothetical protein